jgi:glutathione S-transferase
MKPDDISPLTLVSHALCPYVQRVAIVLMEKGLVFERCDIDLAHKPEWFLKMSPLGKTPVLQVGDVALFESAVICEYLDDTHTPRLHPHNALERARHRAWMEFGSSLLNTIAAFYNANDDVLLLKAVSDIRSRLQTLDAALGDGPYFAGPHFSLVDAVFGPAFRYFDVFDSVTDFDFFSALSRLTRWRAALSVRPSVRAAAGGGYSDRLQAFLHARRSALSRRMRPPQRLDADQPDRAG